MAPRGGVCFSGLVDDLAKLSCKLLAQPEPGLEKHREKKKCSLSCVACERPIPLVGRGQVIRHPFAQSLQDGSYAITGWWVILLLIGFVVSLVRFDSGLIGRGMGWMLIFGPAAPGILLYFLVRLFPLYRVTKCPYCGFSEMTRLRGS